MNEKIVKRQKSIAVNEHLNKVMVRPENNAIMPRLRALRDIEDAERERRQIESKYETKQALH